MCNTDIYQIGKVTTHSIEEGSAETNLLLMLDAMGRRYGKLPSEMFLVADTFDLMVFDVALTYEKMLSDKQNKRVDSSMFDQEQLQDRLEKSRNENK